MHQEFYDEIRSNLFNGKLSTLQVETMEAIFSECDRQNIKDMRQMSYILATAYHECYNPRIPDTRLTPMVEFGGLAYLKSKRYYPYYGRGLSQLTWKLNYDKEGKRLGIDLTGHPELILDVKIAADSHVYCMSHGSYTGKKLSDYINLKGCDYYSARKIINGLDCAYKIAEYAEKFYAALS